MGGRPLAMDKSASRALSDAEAEEAVDAQVSHISMSAHCL